MPYVEDIRRTTVIRDHSVPDDTVINNAEIVEAPARNVPATVISYLLGIVEILLALRLIFRVLGASAGNGFVSGIYALTAPLIAPFAGIFPNDSLAGATLEWATIIAMMLYAIIGGLLINLFSRATRPYATTV